MPEQPIIIVHVADGMMQDIDADTAVRVLVLDADTDGIEASMLSGPVTARARVSTWLVSPNAARIAAVLNEYLQEGGNDDGPTLASGVSG